MLRDCCRAGDAVEQQMLPRYFGEIERDGNRLVVIGRGGNDLAREYGNNEGGQDPKLCCNPLPVAAALHITMNSLQALRFLHAREWVHTDVQPKNVLVSEGKPCMLIDFGACVHVGDVARTRCWEYSAPEQWLKQICSGRTDVFGVTCVLFYLLSGRAPFVGSQDECRIGCLRVEQSFDNLVRGLGAQIYRDFNEEQANLIWNHCGVDGDHGLKHLLYQGMRHNREDRWHLEKMSEEILNMVIRLQALHVIE